MKDFWQFLLLGVGLAPAYVLLAQSMVLVYRGSGVVNFASPAFALLGTFAFAEAVAAGLPTGLALAIGLAVGALSGAVTYWLVMRFLLGAAQLTRVIATLGVQIVVVQALADHPDRDLVGYEVAALHDLVHLAAERGRLVEGAEHVAGRDMRDRVLGRDALRLGSLPRPLRAEHQYVHYLRKPS